MGVVLAGWLSSDGCPVGGLSSSKGGCVVVAGRVVFFGGSCLLRAELSPRSGRKDFYCRNWTQLELLVIGFLLDYYWCLSTAVKLQKYKRGKHDVINCQRLILSFTSIR